MKKIDVTFAKGNFLEDFLRFLKRRKYIRSQRTFCWCPVCKEDLCSSNSMIEDEFKTGVFYQCRNCEAESRWDFDLFPIPKLMEVLPSSHFWENKCE